MEDIYEKLTLVEYHLYFCKPSGRKPITKYYFGIQEVGTTNEEKFYYFAELCY
jgi:hypothetical protein